MEPSRRQRARTTAENALITTAEALRDSVAGVIMERATRPKYADAEHTVLGVLDGRISEIEARTKPGAQPTQKNADLLNLHRDIRSETVAALDERWQRRDLNDGH